MKIKVQIPEIMLAESSNYYHDINMVCVYIKTQYVDMYICNTLHILLAHMHDLLDDNASFYWMTTHYFIGCIIHL